MAKSKTKRSYRFKWWAWVIIVIIVAAAGYEAYSHVSASLNKRSFQNARAAIDNIYFDSVKQIGPADNAQISSSCSRTYQEFTGYGDLTCYLSTNFIYGVNNESEASSLYKQVQNIVSKNFKVLKPAKKLSNSIEDTFAVNTVYHSASDTYNAFGLRCIINYVFDTPREIDLSIKNLSKKPFEITIGCSGPAKQQYYRLAS